MQIEAMQTMTQFKVDVRVLLLLLIYSLMYIFELGFINTINQTNNL